MSRKSRFERFEVQGNGVGVGAQELDAVKVAGSIP